MAAFYKINIPEPCNENWDAMTPKDNGRHCTSCSKTVVDFTGMSPLKIQSYLHLNLSKGVCGKVKQEDLASIKIYIPQTTLNKSYSFSKIFLLALLVTMGSMLFSCTTSSGEKKQVSEVEIIETEKHTDNKIKEDEELHMTLGMISPPPVIKGEMRFDDGEPNFHHYNVDTAPRYIGTPKNATEEEAKAFFQESIEDFVTVEMNKRKIDTIKSTHRQKIFVQFKIDSLGYVRHIKSRAQHEVLEQMAEDVIASLPRFTPANYKGKAVSMLYTLPIVYNNN